MSGAITLAPPPKYRTDKAVPLSAVPFRPQE
jgi:hypothetical protein